MTAQKKGLKDNLFSKNQLNDSKNKIKIKIPKIMNVQSFRKNKVL